jgi:hypothetical protein
MQPFQQLANLTMRLIVTKLLLNFDMEQESSVAWSADFPVFNVWIKPPLMVKLRRIERA